LDLVGGIDLAAKASLVAHGLRARAENCRRKDVTGLVDQGAGEVLAMSKSAIRAPSAMARAVRPPGSESMCSSSRALSSGKAMATSCRPRERAKRMATPAALRTSWMVSEPSAAQADEQKALGLGSGGRVEQEGLAERGFELAGGEPGGGGFGQRVGGGEQRGRGLGVVAGRDVDGEDREERCGEGSGVVMLQRKIHRFIVTRWRRGVATLA
jgi:hypothetical protein